MSFDHNDDDVNSLRNNRNKYHPLGGAGSGDFNTPLQRLAIEQIIRENEERDNKRKNKIVFNQARAKISQRFTRMSNEISNPDVKAYLQRKMLAFGFDPADEKSPTKFPEYDYIDKKNSVNSSMFEETYPPGFLTYLANAWEYDVHIQRALEIKAGLITNNGKGITISMRPTNYLDQSSSSSSESSTTATENVDSILNKYIEKNTRGRLLDYINNVLCYTRLYTVMKDPVMQRMIFGRGGALIRRIKKDALAANTEFEKMGFIEGTPVYINPLSTMAMGRVLVDPVSWKVSDLYYDAPIFGKKPGTKDEDIPADWIPARDLIYLVNKNYHMLPNRLHYGFSDLVTTMPISETLRQIYSEILTEANMNLVLPSLMFTFDDLDEDSMQNYVDNYKGGGIMGRNSNVGVDKIEFSPNINDILNEMRELRKTLNYGTSIPPIFVSDNDINNRAVADRIAEVWTMTDLVPLQDEFSESLYDQFFLPVIRHWLTNEGGGQDATNNFIAAKINVITNFPQLDFADIKAKAETLQILKQNYVITTQQWQKMMLLDPLPEDQVKILNDIQKKLAENPDYAEQLNQFLRGNNTAIPVVPQPTGDIMGDPNMEGEINNPDLLQDAEDNQDQQVRDRLRRIANNQF